MKSLLASLLLAAGLCAGLTVHAQNWPNKPIRIVVNFAPGGAADQLARLIAPPLHEALGQPVLIENKGGAGGNLGAESVAKSPADGYTLLMASGGTVSINPHLYTKMSFDPAKDLVPVASVARVPFYLVVRADSPVKDFKGLIADLKAHPGQRAFGSPGLSTNASLPALAMKPSQSAGQKPVPGHLLPDR